MQTRSTIQETLEKAKPIVGGAVLGAAAITIVGFAANWVVATSTMHKEVEEARVNALAAVCAREAKDHWLAEGKDLAALEGFTNDKREKLAQSFSISVSNWDVKSSVQRHCNEELEQAVEA